MPDCLVATQANVTQLLLDWSKGKQEALDQLTPEIYAELRRIAGRHMRNERPGNTLQSTALVNEAYLKLIDQRQIEWRNRAQFFGVASEIMRRILVDAARAKHAAKRGAGEVKLSLSVADRRAWREDLDLVELDSALSELEALDPRKSRMIELRFFGGLDMEETAEVLGISRATVAREWTLARAWLRRAIERKAPGN